MDKIGEIGIIRGIAEIPQRTKEIFGTAQRFHQHGI